jgi:hypothetical protein
MKTETYLIKHEYDQDKKEMVSKPCKIEMRWKIYDSFACLEIVGFENKAETIKHLLYCHRDQTISILNSLNEQIDNADDLEPCKKDRFYFNESVGVQHVSQSKIKSFKIFTDDKILVGNDIDTALEILENNGYIVELEKEQSNYQLGLHGQLDLEDLISEKVGS